MTAPDFSSPFKLAVAASDVAAGAVLLKENDEGVEHLVCFFPRIASSHKNYSTIEKECLARVLAIQHFEVYVSSSSLPVVVYSDHNPLVFIHKVKAKNQRLLR